jgi:hypothetical protein
MCDNVLSVGIYSISFPVEGFSLRGIRATKPTNTCLSALRLEEYLLEVEGSCTCT